MQTSRGELSRFSQGDQMRIRAVQAGDMTSGCLVLIPVMIIHNTACSCGVVTEGCCSRRVAPNITCLAKGQRRSDYKSYEQSKYSPGWLCPQRCSTVAPGRMLLFPKSFLVKDRGRSPSAAAPSCHATGSIITSSVCRASDVLAWLDGGDGMDGRLA